MVFFLEEVVDLVDSGVGPGGSAADEVQEGGNLDSKRNVDGWLCGGWVSIRVAADGRELEVEVDSDALDGAELFDGLFSVSTGLNFHLDLYDGVVGDLKNDGGGYLGGDGAQDFGEGLEGWDLQYAQALLELGER